MLPLEGEDKAKANATTAAAATATATTDAAAVDATLLFRVPKGLWCYRLDRRRVVLGGALTDGGSVFEWLRGALGLSPGEDLGAVMREVEAMPPNSHGLVVSALCGSCACCAFVNTRVDGRLSVSWLVC